MWSIFLSLCLFFQPNSAEEVMLLDTTESTSELGWTTYPDTGSQSHWVSASYSSFYPPTQSPLYPSFPLSVKPAETPHFLQ
ncbi:ephrin type-B receptor 5-like isoform X2 [Lates japonicus]|uniref:Ephrin type-B receptor 5-like isoform X2 n=1 Tax=Lates japonicus TaxID=270547 RepID=A0AAD3RLM0_LATJO|nr:ephrin type-B receptor 5-like isoform X2 [Lates japonicus]